ncbi:RHS repeat-associated core domain-containing protein [Enterobacter ludwigii]|uniref:RHS repeat-associated core domain-containing protein n=1 Tax=Enterobacter ludwigii TaxID=299767 RepID=UPI003F6FE1F9
MNSVSDPLMDSLTLPRSVTGFNGERIDPVLGNYHLGNGYRMYNPALRRFTAPDDMSPFGKGGINPYTYCEGDPINHTDPTGHFKLPTFIRRMFLLEAGMATGGEDELAHDAVRVGRRDVERAGEHQEEHLAVHHAERNTPAMDRSLASSHQSHTDRNLYSSSDTKDAHPDALSARRYAYDHPGNTSGYTHFTPKPEGNIDAYSNYFGPFSQSGRYPERSGDERGDAALNREWKRIYGGMVERAETTGLEGVNFESIKMVPYDWSVINLDTEKGNVTAVPKNSSAYHLFVRSAMGEPVPLPRISSASERIQPHLWRNRKKAMKVLGIG